MFRPMAERFFWQSAANSPLPLSRKRERVRVREIETGENFTMYKTSGGQYSVGFSRFRRQKQTSVESLLWRKLRNRRLANLKFRRQMPIGPYVVDFCCPTAFLIIELDGDSHLERASYDKIRQESLETKGYRVMRFDNSLVRESLDWVLTQIQEAAAPRPSP